MRVWLATWQAAGRHAEVADEVAAIWNGMWGMQRVAELTDQLYARTVCTPQELLSMARRGWRRPWPFNLEQGRVVCGDNPNLYTRLVSDFRLSSDSSTGLDVVAWVEPNRYRRDEDGNVQNVRYGRAKTVRRRIRGPLSSELIWDRAKRRYKVDLGWGPMV